MSGDGFKVEGGDVVAIADVASMDASCHAETWNLSVDRAD